MTDRIQLKGITWNHSRGLLPMVATAQRFTEIHPEIEIVWEKRSLQGFADHSVDQLAREYDLLVIDHPWAGFAARTETVLPLDKYLSNEFMADQKNNSVGSSFKSYSYNNHQWALAIDSATPVAASRPDLLAQHKRSLPENYDDVLSLANDGLVGFSLIPIDTLMSFYMFCSSLGEDPCQSRAQVVSESIGIEALKLLKALSDKVDPAFFHRNPIRVYEEMVNTDNIAYCPFAYGYSNYSRNGYARKVLHFHDLIQLSNGNHLRSTLGGAGLAISAYSENISTAVKYAELVASPICQQTLFFDNGGQPGHLSAWTNDHTNNLTFDYFKNTLPALQRAFLRPRYHGHMYFQDHAGDFVRDYLLNSGDEIQVLDKMNALYLKSLAEEV
jgi:multiple sugar transport system substrate-binding protein